MAARFTSRQVESSRACALVRCRDPLDHRSEAEELAVARLVDDHLLVILIERGHPHRAREHDVGAVSGIGDLVDALPRRELPQLDQRAQQTELLIVQKPKQRHVSQFFLFARHASPSSRSLRETVPRERVFDLPGGNQKANRRTLPAAGTTNKDVAKAIEEQVAGWDEDVGQFGP